VPEIEFALLVEQWLLDVGLDDVGLLAAVRPPLPQLYYLLDFFERLAHLYPLPAVRALTRLHYPEVQFVLSHAFDLFVPAVVVSLKLKKSGVLHTLDNMEAQGQVLEGISLGMQVVIPHSIEQGLLIADDVVIPEVVVHPAVPQLLRPHHLAVPEVLESQQQPFVAVLLRLHVVLPVAFDLFCVV